MTRGLTIAVVVVAAIAVGVAVAAATGLIGGDDGGDTLSAEEYRDKANALCERVSEQVEELGTPTTPDALGPYFDKVEKLSRKAQDESAALDPPPELETDHREGLRIGERVIDLMADVGGQLERGDLQSAQGTLAEIQRQAAEGIEVNRRMGLGKCSTTPAPAS